MTAVRSVDSFSYGARLFAYLLVVLLVGGGLLALGTAIGYSDARALLTSGVYSRSELAGGAVLAVLGLFVLVTGWFGIVHKLIADSVAAGQLPDRSVTDPAAATKDATTESSESSADDESVAQTGPSPGEQAAREHGTTQTVPSGAASESPDPEPTPLAERSEPTEPAASETEPAPKSIVDDATESQPTGPEQSTSPDPPLETSTDEQMSERVVDETADTGHESPDQSDDWTAGFESPESSTDETPGAGPEFSEEEPSPQPGEFTTDETIDEQSRPEPSPEEIAFGSSSEADEETADESDDVGESDQDESSSIEPAGNPSAGDPLADPDDDK